MQHHRVTVTGREIDEGPWSQRIRDAIRRRQGKDFSVWFICGRWQVLVGRDSAVGQLEAFLKQGFESVDTYSPPRITGITARRYVPVAFASRHTATAPAASKPD